MKKKNPKNKHVDTHINNERDDVFTKEDELDPEGTDHIIGGVKTEKEVINEPETVDLSDDKPKGKDEPELSEEEIEQLRKNQEEQFKNVPKEGFEDVFIEGPIDFAHAKQIIAELKEVKENLENMLKDKDREYIRMSLKYHKAKIHFHEAKAESLKIQSNNKGYYLLEY